MIQDHLIVGIKNNSLLEQLQLDAELIQRRQNVIQQKETIQEQQLVFEY